MLKPHHTRAYILTTIMSGQAVCNKYGVYDIRGTLVGPYFKGILLLGVYFGGSRIFVSPYIDKFASSYVSICLCITDLARVHILFKLT